MLVCSVVLRPKRGTLAATVTETVTAIDAPSINAVFAILADDPGAASATVNAFVGQMMMEAASAAATVNAGSNYPASVVDGISAAISVQDATIGVVGALTPRAGMLDGAYVNSDGTARQANAGGTMVNL